MNQVLTIRVRLLLLVTMLLLLVAAVGGLGFYGMRHALAGMDEVYKDRVVPLRDLKEIADAYAVNIVDTTHKVRKTTCQRPKA
jgi:hypothetical protein